MSDSPLVRVELEFADGKVQTLSGDAANAWLKNVNDILALSQFRSGSPQMKEYPWEHSETPPPKPDPFRHYEGTD